MRKKDLIFLNKITSDWLRYFRCRNRNWSRPWRL